MGTSALRIRSIIACGYALSRPQIQQGMAKGFPAVVSAVLQYVRIAVSWYEPLEVFMQIPVTLERVTGNGYRARCDQPRALVAEGSTREAALRNLRVLFEKSFPNGVELKAIEFAVKDEANPWVQFAGMFHNDAYFDEWQLAIAENRRKADEDPTVP